MILKSSDCPEALGMENYEISNEQVSASSQYSRKHAAHRARLHLQKTGDLKGGWVSTRKDQDKWLQVDLLSNYTWVTGVATQGRNSAAYNQWVTRYKLQYSNDGVSFQYYRERGQATDKVYLEKNKKMTSDGCSRNILILFWVRMG